MRGTAYFINYGTNVTSVKGNRLSTKESWNPPTRVLSFTQISLEALPLLRSYELIDCVLELTTAVKTQIANQREVTEGREEQEGVKTRDSYVEFVFLPLAECWLSSSELSLWKSKPSCE